MILVTGASGLVGSHLIELLSREHPDVPIIGLYHRTLPTVSYSNVQYVSCDLLDIIQLSEVMHGAHHVYHCAAIVSFDGKDARAIIRDNVAMTTHVVDTCLELGVDKLVHISSIAAIGRDQRTDAPGEGLIHEDMYEIDLKKSSVYAISKYHAEMEVWRGMAEGLDVAILNPGIILGEGDWSRSSSKLMLSVAEGLKWYTRGITGYVDVKDVARMAHLLMNSEVVGERFIAVENNYSYEFLLKNMATALQVPGPSKYGAPWKSELLWRLLKFTSMFTGKRPLITKETARTAHAIYHFDNRKFIKYFPSFRYTSITATIERMAAAYRSK